MMVILSLTTLMVLPSVVAVLPAGLFALAAGGAGYESLFFPAGLCVAVFLAQCWFCLIAGRVFRPGPFGLLTAVRWLTVSGCISLLLFTIIVIFPLTAGGVVIAGIFPALTAVFGGVFVIPDIWRT